ncbi:head-tail joining protein [Endozoicomonas euniceicola]|uniref:Head-tail joining protein n=1 Tax=Endozoicomonas euniceicola TaxID=1234143 RepID=A0ABY6GNG0_9GAMM|nr:head-tail joining protein [Endozoicomonas euniceicola]UYM14260.1 head-tail joining protein [Endozoicomonas euniceicola]
MSHFDWEDLDDFLNDDEFAAVAFFHTAQGEKRVHGIFDNAFLLAETGEVDIETTQPRFTCKASDTGLIERGQDVDIEGEPFSVLTVEPDGTGLAVVVLSNE